MDDRLPIARPLTVLMIVAIVGLASGSIIYELVRSRQDIRNLQEEVFRSRRDQNIRNLQEEAFRSRRDQDIRNLQEEVFRSRRDIVDARQNLTALAHDLQQTHQDDHKRLTATLTVPTIPGLQPVRLEGAVAKALPYEIKPGIPVIDFLAGDGINPDWLWTKEGDLPIPWPERYLTLYHHEFNPFTFLLNARQIAAAARAGRTEHRKALPYLLHQLEAFTDPGSDGAAFVSYRFDFEINGRTLKAPWHSAFGNAAVMLGLADLADSGIETHIPTEGYLRGLLTVGATGITRIDSGQYLWFEEYPAIAEHVINGHIATLLTLYHYVEHQPDARVLPYIRAGLTTMRRYLPVARRPGETNAYAASDPAGPDYGPQRMIIYARALAQISSDPEMAAIAAAFETDMPLPPP